MDRFTDLAVAADDEGIYDIQIDVAARDLNLTRGLESASFVSLFSDRRARPDEVANPMKRRGWIGDLVSAVPDDRHGSGVWLYEQSRLTGDVVASLRLEAEASHAWMVGEGLAKTVYASIKPDSAQRNASIIITVTAPSGNVTSRSYVLVAATQTGLLARL